MLASFPGSTAKAGHTSGRGSAANHVSARRRKVANVNNMDNAYMYMHKKRENISGYSIKIMLVMNVSMQ